MMGGGIIGIIVIAVVIWFVFQSGGRGGFNNLFSSKNIEEHSEENSLEILKKRFARGEINKDEFESMKNDLT